MSILDAGCGTGNYALGLLNAGLGHIVMMDGSDGMLKTAHMKTANYQNIAEYRLARLPQLPFPDESFDVVMFNQVGRRTGLGDRHMDTFVIFPRLFLQKKPP